MDKYSSQITQISITLLVIKSDFKHSAIEEFIKGYNQEQLILVDELYLRYDEGD